MGLSEKIVTSICQQMDFKSTRVRTQDAKHRVFYFWHLVKRVRRGCIKRMKSLKRRHEYPKYTAIVIRDPILPDFLFSRFMIISHSLLKSMITLSPPLFLLSDDC